MKTKVEELGKFTGGILRLKQSAILFQQPQALDDLHLAGRVAFGSGYTCGNRMNIASCGDTLADQAFKQGRSATAKRIKYDAIKARGGQMLLDERFREKCKIRTN